MGDAGLQLTTNRHTKFLQRTLAVLPSSLAAFDTQRVTICYFAVAGLDVLGRLDVIEEQRQNIVDWLHLCLICPSPSNPCSPEQLHLCGFRGSPALRLDPSPLASHPLDQGHIAMTYTALVTLIILGNDLSSVDRPAILAGVKALQLADGSFRSALGGGESDMRFLYCAAAICKILGSWEGMDRDVALQYVLQSFSYEGGIGQGPGLEAHGGSTYCGVAALSLMGLLEEVGEGRRAGLVRWCVARQGREGRLEGGGQGFQGRPNKPEDTCYSFWVGATLCLLDCLSLTSPQESRLFVLSTQDPVTGGLAKWRDTSPDPLHTYLGLAGLALGGEEGLLEVEPALNMTKRARVHLEKLQEGWL